MLLCVLYTSAQYSNSRKLSFVVDTLIMSADSMSIIPSSISFKDSLGNAIMYEYDVNKNIWVFPSSALKKKVTLTYRVFPTQFNKQYFNRDITIYEKNSRKYSDDIQKSKLKSTNYREELFASPGLQKTGVISRGVTVGNNHDLVVNSSLNLQLSGNLSDQLRLKAAISDQNVPIQPEGNTQQLRDFDKVYIEVEHDKAKLAAGDIQLKNKDTYFLKYYKNVLGGSFEANYDPFKDSKAKSQVAAGVSKGKFGSIQINVQEGVQGPYRLVGPNGERSIIVLANSEKIYIDGVLLQRGFANDYVIDYNFGQVTFTPNVLITKYSRVRIDFEYSEQNYTRSIITASHYQNYKNASVSINYYSQKDDINANNPLLNNLTEGDKVLLSQIGDTINKAVINSGRTVDFNPGSVLYFRKDTIVNGLTFSNIYVHALTTSGVFYQVSFSDVGQGNGNYIFVRTSANGSVYQWVAPINGIPQGRYEPARLIVTPKQNDMLTLGGKYEITKYENVFVESAFSKNDINLLSIRDKQNDNGFAIKSGFYNSGRPFIGQWKWNSGFDFEHVDKYFAPIDRFRYVEYDRDWATPINYQITDNLLGIRTNPSDNIAQAGAGIRKDENNKLEYKITRRLRDKEVDGFQHRIDGGITLGKILLNGDIFLMDNSRPDLKANWLRYNAGMSYKSKYVQPGYMYSVDQNSNRAIGKDSIISTLMYFNQHKVFVRSSDSGKTSYYSEYMLRDDYLPLEGQMNRSNRSHTANAQVQHKFNNNHNVKLQGTYRRLFNIKDTSSNKDIETIMSRVDWNSNFLKRVIRSEITYVNGVGREQQRQYIYVKAPNGLGNYTWRDENNDGLQQQNEFFEAINFDEKNYIRSIFYTGQFVRSYNSSLNYRLNINLPNEWNNSNTLKRILVRFSNTTAWLSERKTTNPNFTERFLPFFSSGKDSLNTTNNFRTTLFYNRTISKYGLDFTYVNNNQRIFLASGFEKRTLIEYTLVARLLASQVVNLRSTFTTNFKGNNSDFLPTRNYLIRGYLIKPEISWQPNMVWRLTTAYSHTRKENVYSNNSNEAAYLNEIFIESRFNKLSNNAITANFRYIEINTVNLSNINSPLGYEMVDALRQGSNFLWSLNWQQRLINGLQITIAYEGRSATNTPVIHQGRAQINALF
ncbi:MAG: hypothetical protein SFY32_07190 [Bacteroidota bacterium]|nr:hypothetical protein [Bacteroidota bacterium]